MLVHVRAGARAGERVHARANARAYGCACAGVRTDRRAGLRACVCARACQPPRRRANRHARRRAASETLLIPTRLASCAFAALVGDPMLGSHNFCFEKTYPFFLSGFTPPVLPGFCAV